MTLSILGYSSAVNIFDATGKHRDEITVVYGNYTLNIIISILDKIRNVTFTTLQIVYKFDRRTLF